MVEETEILLAGGDDSGSSELRALLDELVGGQPGRWHLVGQEQLRASGGRVLRLRFANHDQTLSVVAKRLSPEVAHRDVLVAQRWLPAVGLGGGCARLLGSAAERSGACVWHVYEDLGPCELDPQAFDPVAVKAAVELIARLHIGFAGHPLLGEVRLHGREYGIHFYETSVQDALCALQAVRPPADRRELCGRLVARLRQLREELSARAAALSEFGGPETLLHGDLWAINVFVSQSQGGLKAKLIDWDRAGVGPASYDLSTFLLRFPERHRAWALGLYQQEVAQAGWRLPETRLLNLLFETAELARYANCVIWPAIELARGQAAWAFDQLADVEQWFEHLSPVIPDPSEARVEKAVSG